MKNCFLFRYKFLRHPEGLSFSGLLDTMLEIPLIVVDCRRIHVEGLQKLLHKNFSESTDFHFTNYSKGVSFLKVQIFILQSANFHFTKYRLILQSTELDFVKKNILFCSILQSTVLQSTVGPSNLQITIDSEQSPTSSMIKI